MKKIIISMILVMAIIATIGITAFGVGVEKDDYLKMVVDMIVEELEGDNEERGTDYEIEVFYQLNGVNVVVHVDGGQEDVDDIYIHLNDYGDFLWTLVTYTDGSRQMIYEPTDY